MIEYTEREAGLEVTTDDGTWFLPQTVLGLGRDPVELTPEVAARIVRPYVSGNILEVKALAPGYFARYTIPGGYLDATEWAYDTDLSRLRTEMEEPNV